MSRDGNRTRTEIMDAAEAHILNRGFAGTTVESVIESADVTKGAFFYHFDTKADLAHALVERYAAHDEELAEEQMRTAEARTDDPARQLVIFVRLFEEMMEELNDPFPGCLFASYCYEKDLFDDHTLEVVENAFLRWRTWLGERLRAAVEAHPPRWEVDAEDLADALSVTFEGAFILSKTLRDPALIARQLRLYREHLELLFGLEPEE